jgi:hypothetical protein
VSAHKNLQKDIWQILFLSYRFIGSIFCSFIIWIGQFHSLLARCQVCLSLLPFDGINSTKLDTIQLKTAQFRLRTDH